MLMQLNRRATAIVLDSATAASLARWAWRSAAIALMTIALLAPALWNHFPIVFADTGGYLLRPIEGALELGRSALYGDFLLAGLQLDFWPDVIVQAGLSVWLVLLVLRTHGWGGRTDLALSVILVLALTTSLPWFAAQLMPDIFVPLAALALYLLAYQGAQLHVAEKIALGAVIAFGIASHMSILALAILMLGALAIVRTAPAALILPRPRMATPVLAVAAGIALALGSNFLIAGVFGFTPGGSNFLFARLLQDGIIARYLKDKCPNPTVRLCAYRETLPTSGDDWMWRGESPLVQLGGWQEFEPEANRIIRDTVLHYPEASLGLAIQKTLKQLVVVKTGDGINSDNNWHVEWVLHEHAPRASLRYLASPQHKNEFSFTAINFVHVPVALMSTVALPFLFVFLLRRRPPAAAFVMTTLIALVANAAICGIFSGPASRYQSRLVPIATLAAIISALDLRRRRPTEGEPPAIVQNRQPLLT